MKYEKNDLIKLEELLANYKINLEENILVNMSNSYNKFYSSFHRFYTTLLSEKIITEDPYGEEYDLESLISPESSEISYNEEGYIISIRLAHLYSLFTFIKTDELMHINKLNPIKIDRISNLLQFMNWDRLFDPQPVEVNTEALNKVLFYYQKDRGQHFIIASLKASMNEIFTNAKATLDCFKKLKLFYSEEYKLLIRKMILPTLKLPPEIYGANIKQAHDLISNKLTEEKLPLYIELIGEILKEDFSSDGEVIRNSINEKLSKSLKKVTPKSVKEKSETPIEMLEKVLIELSKIPSQVGSIKEKFLINSEFVREETYSIFEKFLDFLTHTLIGTKRKTIYIVKILDPTKTTNPEKEIELESFLVSLDQLSSTLDDYKNLDSDRFKHLIAKGEDDLEIVVRKILSKAKYMYKILNSLDSFFRKNLKDSRGIKIELKVILSLIDKGQVIYFEYKKTKSDDQTSYKPDISLTT